MDSTRNADILLSSQHDLRSCSNYTNSVMKLLEYDVHANTSYVILRTPTQNVWYFLAFKKTTKFLFFSLQLRVHCSLYISVLYFKPQLNYS